MKIILAIILGAFFGYALFIAGAINPKKLLAMLRLEDLTLAKTIFFAIGLSSTLLSLVYAIGIFNIDNLSVKTMNLGVILGGIIFGLGFGSIGSCPGTCVGLAATNAFKKAFTIIVGGLVGAFVFTLSYGYLKDIGLISGIDFGKLTLFKISPEYPSVFSIGYLGLLLTGIVFMLAGWYLPKNIINK